MSTNLDISFSRPDHTNSLTQVLEDVLFVENLKDVSIWCEGKILKAHKLVLSGCSLFFHKVFTEYVTATQPFVVLVNVKFEHLEKMIQFMYEGQTSINHGELKDFLNSAAVLQVKGLIQVGTSLGSDTEKPSPVPYNSESSLNQTSSLSPGPSRVSVPNPPNSLTMNNCPRRKLSVERSVGKKTGATRIGDDMGHVANEEPLAAELTLTADPDYQDGVLIKIEPTSDGEGFQKKVEREEGNGHNEAIRDEPHLKDRVRSSRTRKRPLKLEEALHQKGKNSRNGPKVPRPTNPFMLFSTEWRRKIALQNPGEGNRSISARLGAMWKSLSDEAKDRYYADAKLAAKQHTKLFSGNLYPPRAQHEKLKRTSVPTEYSSAPTTSDNQEDMDLSELPPLPVLYLEDGGTYSAQTDSENYRQDNLQTSQIKAKSTFTTNL